MCRNQQLVSAEKASISILRRKNIIVNIMFKTYTFFITEKTLVGGIWTSINNLNLIITTVTKIQKYDQYLSCS